MNRQKILSIIKISILSFLIKVALEIVIEWTNIMPLKVKAHFFGDFLRSAHYIWYDFVIHIWLYILFTLIVFFILNYTKISRGLLLTVTPILIAFILLYLHNFQFPKKQYYFPSEIDLNFKLIEEFLIYSISGLLIVFLVGKSLTQSKT